MRKYTWMLFFLLSGFFSCSDNDTVFDAPTEGLEIKFTPVAGGAMMYYSLPDNGNIFAMNVRYTNSQGQNVLKSCGYGGDSLLLDGFSRGQEGIRARISFVNHRNEESTPLEYQFKTQDSAPWAFFDDIDVASCWNGFQVTYKTPPVVTGMAHVFYLGVNPVTHQEDTILVGSFPINRNGGFEKFTTKQGMAKHTVIIRTEDFQGYRVRQEIYPDVDAFLSEKLSLTAADFNDFGLSKESEKAQTGVKYLFDGELKGIDRFYGYASETELKRCTEVFSTYLAGPNAFGKPLMVDLKGERVPAWIRLYCLIPLKAGPPYNSSHEFGTIWKANYEDKLPCRLKVYGGHSSEPNTGEWVLLGELNHKPETLVGDRWSYPTSISSRAPTTLEKFLDREPIYTDIVFPAVFNTYRYLKIVVSDTYRRAQFLETNDNLQEYITLHELEVYVKKN